VLIEDMDAGWPITFGMAECALHLDIIRTHEGYQRALRIVKRYGVEHTLNWIPFDVTSDGVRLRGYECVEADMKFVPTG